MKKSTVNFPNVKTLEDLKKMSETTFSSFFADKGRVIDLLDKMVRLALFSNLDQFEKETNKEVRNDPFVKKLLKANRNYIDWMCWTLGDAQTIGGIFSMTDPVSGEILANLHLLSHSLRIFDDVIDEHHTYKGKNETLLNKVEKLLRINSNCFQNKDRRSFSISNLVALLTLFRGLNGLLNSHIEENTKIRIIKDACELYQKTLVGLILELSPTVGAEGEYENIVGLKSIPFSILLFSPFLNLLPRHYVQKKEIDQTLKPLWELSQILNDINDLSEDLLTGQPSFILNGLDSRIKDQLGGLCTSEILGFLKKQGLIPLFEEELTDRFSELISIIAELSPPMQLFSLIKLSTLFEEFSKMGFRIVNDKIIYKV
jgi:hypothetical protein